MKRTAGRGRLGLALTAVALISASCIAGPSDQGPTESSDQVVAELTTTEVTFAEPDTSQPLEPGTLIRVEIQPCVGLGMQRATAMAVGPDFALTAAHSFESAEAATLRFSDSSGRELTVAGRLVASDADKDVAVIQPAEALAEAWKPFNLGEPEVGESVTVESYALVDGPITKQAEVLRLVNATLDGEGRRAAVELEADIKPGDSGAPVLNTGGQTIGMIFASSRTSERGWAVRSNELAAAVSGYVESGPDELVGDLGFQCPEP